MVRRERVQRPQRERGRYEESGIGHEPGVTRQQKADSREQELQGFRRQGGNCRVQEAGFRVQELRGSREQEAGTGSWR
jgi:hypothetical protein